MNLTLTTGQASELNDLLGVALRELTHEIAATDNAVYRARLLKRRRLLEEVAGAVGQALVRPVALSDRGGRLERQLAHPGD